MLADPTAEREQNVSPTTGGQADVPLGRGLLISLRVFIHFGQIKTISFPGVR
jgi:hypothetical protein